MGILELKHEIEANAKKEAGRIKAEAEKEAWHVVEKAEEERKKMVGEARVQGEAVAKEEERRVSSARLRARHNISEAKEAVVVKVLDELSAQLRELTLTKEYPPAFNRLAQAAVKELGADKAVIECRKEDDALAKKLGFPTEAIDCAGGAVAKTVDGRVRVSNTFETLLELKQEELKRRAFLDLFGA
ncbi:MAG: V-type ATP synthase subunit E family protein [Candidatus Micrarchaeota archaeon]|nr:V-type ATP synthase subunit E family protein [Candidatus Micrarchaeota archaeon]